MVFQRVGGLVPTDGVIVAVAPVATGFLDTRTLEVLGHRFFSPVGF